MKSLFVLSCLVVCGLSTLRLDARYIKRNAEDNDSICSRSTPCGWEVYKPHERTVVFFMQSPCVCSENTQCMRTEDDLSLSAYVHRCVPVGVSADEWSYDSLEG